MPLLNDKLEVSWDLLAHLEDPEFNDVKIEASDVGVPANRTIMSLRSQYFSSMLSANNNFLESSTQAALPESSGSEGRHLPQQRRLLVRLCWLISGRTFSKSLIWQKLEICLKRWSPVFWKRRNYARTKQSSGWKPSWPGSQSTKDKRKEIVLQSLDFEHFTHKDLASDVWKSGFYPIDVIMKRMEELYDSMDRAHQVDDDLLTTVSDINNRRSLRSLTYNVNSTQCWPPKP